MIPRITKLLIKIEQLEWDLGEVKLVNYFLPINAACLRDKSRPPREEHRRADSM